MSSSKPPDGGWGWIVVSASMIIQALFGCVVRGFGVLYLRMLERFNQSPSATTFVGTAFLLAWGLGGPAGSAILHHLSCRTVAFSGCLLLSAAFVVSGFAPNLLSLYMTFAAAGVGTSLAFNTSFLIVIQYFDRRKAFAIGCTTLGSALGMFALPPVVEIFFQTYGFTGGMLLFAGITLHGCVAATLFVPLERRAAVEFNNKDDALHERDVKREQGIEPLHENEKEQRHYDELFNEKETKPAAGEYDRGQCAVRVHSTNKQPLSKMTFIPAMRRLKVYCSLFTDPFIFSMVCIHFCLFFTVYYASTFTPAVAVEIGYSQYLGSILVMANGGADAASKVLSSPLFDISCVRPYRGYVFCILGLLSGLVIALVPICGNYEMLLAAMLFFGSVNGGFGGQRNTILADLVQASDLPDVLGLTVLSSSLGCIISSVFGGFSKDVLGTYNIGFYLAGLFISGASIFLMILIKRYSLQQVALSRRTGPFPIGSPTTRRRSR